MRLTALTAQNVIDFADCIDEACTFDGDIWCLFRELLISEDGYIRYDHDPDNAAGDMHPLHHLDVFYSSGSTFKLGLRNSIDTATFEDYLDITTACRYIQS